MSFFAERRKYQRCNTTICKVMMSRDRTKWSSLDLCDISAGGLKFVSDHLYDGETNMYFDIYVYNMLSEFNLKLEGRIIRKEKLEDLFAYAVHFVNVDKYTRVQLDELIKSKITVSNVRQHGPEDGIYTFLFIPGARSRKMKSAGKNGPTA